MTALLKSVLRALGIVIALGLNEAYSSGLRQAIVLRADGESFTISPTPLASSQTNVTEAPRDDGLGQAIERLETTYPSEFINNHPLYLVQATTGRTFDVYEIPGDLNNCGIFAIYGRENITREQIVTQLLANSNREDVRRWIAEAIFHDILLLDANNLPAELEQRQGKHLRGFAQQYHASNGAQAVRESILQELQQTPVFGDYVRYYIGGHINDDPENDYLTLGYRDLTAIGIMNDVAVHIYQENTQADGSRLLVRQFPEKGRDNEEGARTISLLHTTANPREAPDALNHYNLLLSADQHPLLLNCLQEDAKAKLKTVRIAGFPEEMWRFFVQQFESILKRIPKPQPADINDALHEVLERQIRVQLKSFSENCLSKQGIPNPLASLSSSDPQIQEFFNQWSNDFVWQTRELQEYLPHHYKLIIGGKINCTPINGGGNTLLHRAAFRGLDKIVTLLLAKNIFNVNVEDKEGRTPLYEALQDSPMQAGQRACIRALMDAGARAQFPSTAQNPYPLSSAAANGLLDLTNALLRDNHADPNLIQPNGFAPMHLAARYGHADILMALIAGGGDVNLLGREGLTPLHIAMIEGQREAAHILLQQKANPDMRVKGEGVRAIHIAIFKGYTGILRMLIHEGANINLVDGDQFTPLRIAVGEGNTEIVKILLGHGADPNPPNGPSNIPDTEYYSEEASYGTVEIPVEHMSPLHQAAYNNQMSIAGTLIHWGANIEEATGLGYTPLFAAVMQGNVQMVRLLLEKGRANPNVQAGSSLATPLVIALLKNYDEIAEILLNADASIDAKDEVVSPIKIAQAAAQEGDQHMLELLKPYIRNVEALPPLTDEEVGQARKQTSILEVELEALKQQWERDRSDKKKNKVKFSQATQSIIAEAIVPISEENLSGSRLRLRGLLTRVLIEQPNTQIHGDEIMWLIRHLGGEIKIKGNHYRVYFNKKFIDYYEILHDKDPKGFLTRGWVKRLAQALQRALDQNLINQQFKSLFSDPN